MISGCRLRTLELEAFRAFGAAQIFDLDADAVLVRGDNGTGKTSLTDGLLWLFCGEIPRLTERLKGLRKGRDPIINAYTGGPARVRLTFQTSSLGVVSVERKGDNKTNELSWVSDSLASASRPELQLSEAFGHSSIESVGEAVRVWGILQQHAVTAALDSGALLHQRLAAIVGLDRVTAFAESANRTTRRLRSDLSQVSQVRDTLERQVEASRQSPLVRPSEVVPPRTLAIGLEEAAEDLPSGIDVDLARVGVSGGTVREFLRSVDSVVALCGTVEGRARAVADLSRHEERALEDLEQELAVAERRAHELTAEEPSRRTLAAAALELLVDQTCPVCGQTVDEPSLRKHLEELATADASDAAQRAREALLNIRKEIARARDLEQQSRAAVAALDASWESLSAALDSLEGLGVSPPWRKADRASGLARSLGSFRDRAEAAVLRSESEARSVRARTRSQEVALRAEFDRATKAVAEAGERVARAEALEKASRSAGQRLVERALAKVEPSFAEVFDRLVPHPTFTELHARQDTYYGKNQVIPEVYDAERRLAANPSLVLSEGQLNVVALSYFLGLALNASDGGLPFLILDDPLQAMDTVGALGFADLCRRIREHKQMIVTTHDRRFASLLARKLAPRVGEQRTLLHEFGAWTREGPEVVSREEPLGEVIPLIAKDAS